jgi:hypothetical protein
VAIHGTHLSAVYHNRLKSITSHFTSTVPLFAAPYISYAQHYRCKTYASRLFASKLTTNGHSWHIISWHNPFTLSLRCYRSVLKQM